LWFNSDTWFRGQFHGCALSEGAHILVSGLLDSKTPDSKNISVRGVGILPSGSFREGTLTVSLWSGFRPFQAFGFEFDLINPSRAQEAKQVLVSVSDPGGLSIPATKAFGTVLGVSDINVDEGGGISAVSSQVISLSLQYLISASFINLCLRRLPVSNCCLQVFASATVYLASSMAQASTTLHITLVPSRVIAQGAVVIRGFNHSITPLLSGITIAPAGKVSNFLTWNQSLQALSFRSLGDWSPSDTILMDMRVTNGVFKSTASLTIFVDGTDNFLAPGVRICSRAAITYASVSETSVIQGQNNKISVVLEFNFEVVRGTKITLSGFLDTLTPDNDELNLDDGINYLLGYSGVWKQNIGQLVVTATESLNLGQRQLVISFTVKNAVNPKFTRQSIQIILMPSEISGTCGGRICDLTPASSASRCEQSTFSNPFALSTIPTSPDFLVYKESPRFVTFQVSCTNFFLLNDILYKHRTVLRNCKP
jgi:hypothetical protein